MSPSWESIPIIIQLVNFRRCGLIRGTTVFQFSTPIKLAFTIWERDRVMVLNATFNNISIYKNGYHFYWWRKTGEPRENHQPVASHEQTWSHKVCIERTSPWTGFELITLVVIGTDCTGSCKSNYHTIMTTTTPHSQ